MNEMPKIPKLLAKKEIKKIITPEPAPALTEIKPEIIEEIKEVPVVEQAVEKVAEVPKEAVLTKDEEKIKELSDYIVNLQFLSDQTKFNSVVFQGLNLIADKLAKIDEKLNMILPNNGQF